MIWFNGRLNQGGLGIRSIEMGYKALLGKWLWMVGSLEVFYGDIVQNFKLGIDGWCVPSQDDGVSDFWKSYFC